MIIIRMYVSLTFVGREVQGKMCLLQNFNVQPPDFITYKLDTCYVFFIKNFKKRLLVVKKH